MSRTSRSPGLILKASQRAAWTASIEAASCSRVYCFRTSISTVGMAVLLHCRRAHARPDLDRRDRRRTAVDSLARAVRDRDRADRHHARGAGARDAGGRGRRARDRARRGGGAAAGHARGSARAAGRDRRRGGRAARRGHRGRRRRGDHRRARRRSAAWPGRASRRRSSTRGRGSPGVPLYGLLGRGGEPRTTELVTDITLPISDPERMSAGARPTAGPASTPSR